VRIIFMGTPEFAVPSLRALTREHEVTAVYTRPDAVSGRGTATRPAPVKQAATELGLAVEQPSSLRDTDAQRTLEAYAPEVCVVAAYGLILPPAVLAIPPLGCVNVHGSLLPRWRGAAPVQRAILAGDTVTGVSIMQMEEGLDTGPFCEVESIEIADKNADQVLRELADAGAEALIRALRLMEAGGCTWTVQDEACATYAAKITKTEVALHPELNVDEALRRVRASGAQAPSRATIEGKGVTVTSAEPAQQVVGPGSVAVNSGEVLLGLADGALRVKTLKPDGKRDMVAVDWARGLRLEPGAQWARA
jgi:methionyl-tRNA formyltransferase